MEQYLGPAIIEVARSGVLVIAQLFSARDPSDGKVNWCGRATPKPPGSLWPAYIAQGATLRIGRDVRRVVITQCGEPGASELTGNGPPPF
ncbi:MAG: DUF4873 domain-containing protein [Sporichthyaceae bacterium]